MQFSSALRRCGVPLVLAAIAAIGASCARTKADEKPADRPVETPLLLLDEAPEAAEPAASGADNSRCQVCHLNLAQETLALTHAAAHIGCAKCHGPSDAHIADESWGSGGNGTAPDVMFTRDAINPFCLGCHPKDTIDPDQHKELFAGTSTEKYCTECHGKHRLVTRRCKWK
jgi:hypothetical protein